MGGKIRIYNPHWSNFLAYKDITHKWYPTGYSYDQFETHPNYYSKFAKFKIKKVVYSIGSHQKKHKIVKRLFIKVIDILININRDFTEYILCRYIPINETYYELEVKK